MQILLVLVVVMGAGVAALMMVSIAYAGYRFYRILKSIDSGLTGLNDTLSGLPPLMQGINKLCIDLVGSTTKISGGVEIFNKNLFESATSGPRRPGDGFSPYDERAAGREFEVIELMRSSGLSEQQARERIMAGAEGRFTVNDDE